MAVNYENDAAANKDNKARETLHDVLIVSAFSKGFSGGKVESKMVRNITGMSNKYYQFSPSSTSVVFEVLPVMLKRPRQMKTERVLKFHISLQFSF